MIRHTVSFRLRHPAGSTEERAFLDASLELASIPGVHNFQRWRQVGAKSDHTFGFSMEFETQAAYDAYTAHPQHDAYVTDLWLPEVADFQEIDYVALD